jgi:hypothetical protein
VSHMLKKEVATILLATGGDCGAGITHFNSTHYCRMRITLRLITIWREMFQSVEKLLESCQQHMTLYRGGGTSLAETDLELSRRREI